MCLAEKLAHIDTHFGDDGLCVHNVDAFDLSQAGGADRYPETPFAPTMSSCLRFVAALRAKCPVVCMLSQLGG